MAVELLCGKSRGQVEEVDEVGRVRAHYTLWIISSIVIACNYILFEHYNQFKCHKCCRINE